MDAWISSPLSCGTQSFHSICLTLALNQAKDTASIIRTSGLRLLQLINDILDAAKMKQCQGGIVIKQEKVWGVLGLALYNLFGLFNALC